MDHVDGVFILTSSEYYSFTYFSHNHVANTSFNTSGTVDDQRIGQRTAANHPINAWTQAASSSKHENTKTKTKLKSAIFDTLST